jgi:hypothetical protein
VRLEVDLDPGQLRGELSEQVIEVGLLVVTEDCDGRPKIRQIAE